MIYAKLCKSLPATLSKTVPICDKSIQNVRNLPTRAQFGTVLHIVKHTYVRLSTKIISTRGVCR